MRNHRGFTLVELMVVLIIMLTVTAGMYKLLNTTQRLSRAQAERVDLQSNVRTAALVVPSELREINTVVGGAADKNDITDKQQTSITYRAMRGVGFVCEAVSASQFRVRIDTWSGERTPAINRDSVYVFFLGTSLTTDSWEHGKITNVSTGTNCPGAVPAYTLTLNAALAGGVPTVGTPVRTFEVMKLELYNEGGKSWLGARSVSGNDPSSQPLLGPLRAVDGFSLQYLNAAGGAAAALGDIKSVKLTVRGETSQRVSTGGGNSVNAYMQDSLVTQVSLRNAFRP